VNELVVIEKVNAVQVFAPGGIDDLLLKIEQEAKSIVPDITTPKGRKEIASIAHKVAKSKTQLDSLGKDLVAEWKTKASAVDAERKKMREFLDNLKTEVRAPLTEWEEKEAARQEGHITAINEMESAASYTADCWQTLNLEAMKDRLAEIEAERMGEAHWDEFAGKAAEAKDYAIKSIKESIAKREAYDAEQAELARLRAESEERERKEREAAAEKARIEREERIAKEAAEAATKAAEESAEKARIKAAEAAKAEQDRIEREKQDAINKRL
jgi:hypothetical protein